MNQIQTTSFDRIPRTVSTDQLTLRTNIYQNLETDRATDFSGLMKKQKKKKTNLFFSPPGKKSLLSVPSRSPQNPVICREESFLFD